MQDNLQSQVTLRDLLADFHRRTVVAICVSSKRNDVAEWVKNVFPASEVDLCKVSRHTKGSEKDGCWASVSTIAAYRCHRDRNANGVGNGSDAFCGVGAAASVVNPAELVA